MTLPPLSAKQALPAASPDRAGEKMEKREAAVARVTARAAPRERRVCFSFFVVKVFKLQVHKI
jgi:hypothetical protein